MLFPQCQPFCMDLNLLYKLVLERNHGIILSGKKWFYGNGTMEIDSVPLVAHNFAKLDGLLFRQNNIEIGLLTRMCCHIILNIVHMISIMIWSISHQLCRPFCCALFYLTYFISLNPGRCVCNFQCYFQTHVMDLEHAQIAKFTGPTWSPSGADRNQVGPMLAPWT